MISDISFHPTLTSLSSLEHNPKKEKTPFQVSKVLLFKGVPQDIEELEIVNICHSFGIVKDILLIKQKRYVFAEFENQEQAENCYFSLQKFPISIRGFPLYVFYTGKYNINKSDARWDAPSRFLIIVFDKEYLAFNKNHIYQLFKPFGTCLQIFPIQMMPLNVIIEMEDVGQAILAKKNLDKKVVFGSTYISLIYCKENDIPIQTKNLLDSEKIHQKFSSFTQYFDLAKKQTFLFSEKSINSEEFIDHSAGDPLTESKDFLDSLLEEKEEKPNKILLVKNLPKNITARNLFVLFGMYGNVQKVKIFFKNPEKALIEYQDLFQANLAKNSLNNCILSGRCIVITDSIEGSFIDTSFLNKEEENEYLGDYTKSKEHRYKFAGSKNHSNIAPPSKVLHLSNLCLDKAEDFYRELFKSLGNIRKFMFLKVGKKMALMEMENVSQAVSILINFHNYNIDGKFLKVSFSKYTKIKESLGEV